MKKNILIIFMILAFILTTFGKPPNRRIEDNSPERFITKQLNLLGLKVGKVSIVGENGFIAGEDGIIVGENGFTALIIGFSSKTNALKLIKPFKSFSLKGTLKRLTLRSKGIIEDNKNATGPVIINNKNATGPVIINNKNTKLVINGNALIGANFIIGENEIPKGIIFEN